EALSAGVALEDCFPCRRPAADQERNRDDRDGRHSRGRVQAARRLSQGTAARGDVLGNEWRARCAGWAGVASCFPAISSTTAALSTARAGTGSIVCFTSTGAPVAKFPSLRSR